MPHEEIGLAGTGQARLFRSTRIRCLAFFLPCLWLAACSSSAVRELESLNHNSRVNIVVIHFTTANFEESVQILTQPSSNSVSAHYLIPESPDPTYEATTLRPIRLVPESRRAWHAGQSYWRGKTGLNDQSIGIELVNRAYCHANTAAPPADGAPRPPLCFFPDYSLEQIEMLVKLLSAILERHPDIHPTDFVGHSDIAPDRKIDPGPRFPWRRLSQLGFGAWYEDSAVIRFWEQFQSRPVPLANLQQALHVYGYDIEVSGVCDQQTSDVVRAFQMHFRPQEVTGTLSVESAATLFALIEKYYPQQLDELLATTESSGEQTYALQCQRPQDIPVQMEAIPEPDANHTVDAADDL